MITYKQIQKVVLSNKGLNNQYLIEKFCETNFDKINNNLRKKAYIKYLSVRHLLSKIYHRLYRRNWYLHKNNK